MSEFGTTGLVIAGCGVSLAICYSAWFEFARRNLRDAKLLATVGALGAAGSATLWFA